MSKNFSTELRRENDKYYKITGVDKWHEAGYYGERVIAASGENWDIEDYNPDNLIDIPFGNGTTSSNWHGVTTCKVFHQVAPMARVVQLPCSAVSGGGKYDSRFIKESIPYIKEHGVCLMFKSTSAGGNSALEDAMQEVKDFFTMTISAGNEGDDSYNGWAKYPSFVSIPAYQISADGRFRIEGYSSETEYNDFAGPSWIATPPTGNTQGGTSFSNPWVCGMMALVNDLFIEKTGRPLSNAMMQQFFKDNSIDIGDEGFDIKTGFGMAYLPPPETVDINKYSSGNTPVDPPTEPEEEKITMIEQFTDYEQISTWARDDLQYCLDNGLMNGKGNAFDPKGTLTREEEAVTSARIHRSLMAEITRLEDRYNQSK